MSAPSPPAIPASTLVPVASFPPLADKQPVTNAVDPLWLKFVLGGSSCSAAACVTNPVDVVKTRLQLQGELVRKQQLNAEHIKYKGFLRGGLQVWKEEGLRGLYKGLTASVLREASYSTIRRMGGYDVMKELLGAHDPKTVPLWKKIAAGGTSGAVGAAIANPTDLVKVRFQAEGANTKPRYRNVFQAFVHIWRHEQGLKGLYKGVGPTTKRAALLTAAQLASYDHSKHFFLNMGLMEDGPMAHFSASMVAGLMAAIVTSPVDVVKTRIMNQSAGSNLYSSSWDCVMKTIKAEGLMGLYKGFIPNWMRIGPHTIVTFLVYEQLRRLCGLRPV
ncbi:Mitochondrial carrier [Balamuthia mandrillaris]